MAIAYQVRRRVVGDIQLLFYAHDEVILVTKNGATIFHSWFTRSRKYTFRPFVKALRHNQDITSVKVFELAEYFGIQHTADSYGKHITLLSTIDTELPSKGRMRNADTKEALV